MEITKITEAQETVTRIEALLNTLEQKSKELTESMERENEIMAIAHDRAMEALGEVKMAINAILRKSPPIEMTDEHAQHLGI